MNNYFTSSDPHLPLLVGQFSDFPQISLSTLSGPWSAKGAKLPKHLGGVVVGNRVYFAKSIVGGPVFGFSAKFSKYPEWARERQRSKTDETKLLGFSSLEILYVLPHRLLLGQFSDFRKFL